MEKEKRFRPIPKNFTKQFCANIHKEITESYIWNEYLENVLLEMAKRDDMNDAFCSEFAVPISSFHSVPFVDVVKKCDFIGIRVEVALDNDYSVYADISKIFFWFARIIKMAGYRLLLRFEGMDEKGDECYDFWISIASSDLHYVGFSSENAVSRALIPPESIVDRQEDWSQYLLLNLCNNHKTIFYNWTEMQRQIFHKCKFKSGERVELLDSRISTRVRPAIIRNIIGNRLQVFVDKKSSGRSKAGEEEEDSQIVEGIWLDENSPLIFHIGWAINVGYELKADKTYKEHCEKIVKALRTGFSEVPFETKDAKPSQFANNHYGFQNSYDNKDVWKIGMKLEVLDPLDTWKELRVATVLKIMDEGFLKIGFDGHEIDEDAIPIHSSSPLLFPVGYAEKYGIPLKGPAVDGNSFNWISYIQQTQSIAAPESLFHAVPDENLMKNNFKIGAKLEAVDMCEPYLICVATVAGHKGRLLQIRYDGWDSSYDQLFDYRSNNIYPLGWCEINGYKLEAPNASINAKK